MHPTYVLSGPLLHFFVPRIANLFVKISCNFLVVVENFLFRPCSKGKFSQFHSFFTKMNSVGSYVQVLTTISIWTSIMGWSLIFFRQWMFFLKLWMRFEYLSVLRFSEIQAALRWHDRQLVFGKDHCWGSADRNLQPRRPESRQSISSPYLFMHIMRMCNDYLQAERSLCHFCWHFVLMFVSCLMIRVSESSILA